MLRAISKHEGDKKRQEVTRNDILNANIDNNDNTFNDEDGLPYLLR